MPINKETCLAYLKKELYKERLYGNCACTGFQHLLYGNPRDESIELYFSFMKASIDRSRNLRLAIKIIESQECK